MDETEIRQIIDRELMIVHLIEEITTKNFSIGKEIIYQEIRKEMRMRAIQEEQNGFKNKYLFRFFRCFLCTRRVIRSSPPSL